MSLAFDRERQGRRPPLPRAPESVFAGRWTPHAAPSAEPIASRDRAHRRRAARRDEQAVASWLRELASRPR
jgi:hypothetical protein